MALFKCEDCGSMFVRRDNLSKHKKIKHNKYYFHCNDCGKGFNAKTQLNLHMEEHGITVEKKTHSKRIICAVEDCDAAFTFYSQYHKHLLNCHEIDIEKDRESFTFKSKQDFVNWKEDFETKHYCQYALNSGEKYLQNSTRTRMYYVCHRSYTYTPDVQETIRKRKLKSLGSNKIGTACPSVMIADEIKKTNEFRVELIRTHLGHICEVIRNRIPTSERDRLAGKLRIGVPKQRILSDIRGEDASAMSDRAQFIETLDLRNIIRDYGVTYETRTHSNDAISVDNLIEKLKRRPDNPILHYDNGESGDGNFILILQTNFQKEMLQNFGECKILIDGTHGLNAYKVQLFSIVVIDEFGNGIPVGFCFSKKYDTEAMVVFFENVKANIGKELKTKVFMSDDAPQFYNAWAQVMGTCDHHLLCWWHINKNWTINLNAKIKDNNKKDIISKTLYTLATNCDIEPSDFYLQLREFVNDLLHDPETKEFHDYFSRNYVNNVTTWAFCFRKHLGINTNMALENLHRRIKILYLKGMTCARLDMAINALFEVIRDMMFQRMIKIAKNKPSDRIQRIHRSHIASLKLVNDNITESFELDDFGTRNIIWKFLYPEKNREYVIKKINDVCSEKLCVLKCIECNVCIHTFKCSCPDSVIYLNLCKHIHKVGLFVKPDDLLQFEAQNDDIETRNVLIEQVRNHLFTEKDAVKSGDSNTAIEIQLQIALGCVREADLDQRKRNIVKKKLDGVLQILKENRRENSQETLQKADDENINIRKKITPQRSILCLTSSKRKKVELLKKPNTAEKDNCKEILKGLCIQSKPMADHNYLE